MYFENVWKEVISIGLLKFILLYLVLWIWNTPKFLLTIHVHVKHLRRKNLQFSLVAFDFTWWKAKLNLDYQTGAQYILNVLQDVCLYGGYLLRFYLNCPVIEP